MPASTRRLALVSALAATAGLLGACSDDDGGTDDPGGSAASANGSGASGSGDPDAESTLTLATLLTRSGDSEGVAPRQVDFSLDARLRQLIDPDATLSEDPWGPSLNSGTPDLYSVGPDELSEFGIDLDTTEAAITVGTPPAKVGLLLAGQDAEAIATAAGAAGWVDQDGVLTSDLNPEQPLSIAAPQLLPDGPDLIYGGRDADLSLVGAGAPTLADRPDLAALAACLDDALSGTIAAVDGTLVAVGATPESADSSQPRSVICVAAESADDAESVRADMQEAVESGTSVHGMTYSEYLSEPESDVLDGDVAVARLIATNTEGHPAFLIQQMLSNLDLPGLQVAQPGVTPTPSD